MAKAEWLLAPWHRAGKAAAGQGLAAEERAAGAVGSAGRGATLGELLGAGSCLQRLFNHCRVGAAQQRGSRPTFPCLASTVGCPHPF